MQKLGMIAWNDRI